MRKDYLILLVFLGLILVSGAAIYVYMDSRPVQSSQAQDMGSMTPPDAMTQMPAQEGPDRQTLQKQIDQLESQLKSNPADFDILVNLGNNYYDIGEPAKAIASYEKALSIKPDQATVMVDCGAMYRQMGNPDKAIELFNKAILTDPKLPQAYFNLGMVFAMEKKDLPNAAKAWKKYLELDPNSEAKDFILDEIKKAEEK